MYIQKYKCSEFNLFVTCCIVTGTQINFHLAATPVTYECAKLKAKKIDPLKNFSPTNQSWKMYFFANCEDM